jgi:hypothetical protein
MIATLAQLKLYLWISNTDSDTLLTLFLNGANQIIATYIGRNIEAADYETIVDWNWQLFFMVDGYPINSIDAISINTWTIEVPVWEALDANSYSFNSNVWKINFLSPVIRWFQNYKIEYNGWYTAIPADLTLASCKMASKYYNSRNSDWVASESVAGDSISFDVSQIPNDILVILSNYRNV